MINLRQSIIDSISSSFDEESDLLETIKGLVEKEGEEVYPTLINILTHLEFDANDAKANWDRILAHRDLLETKLDRPVKLITAMCDYFCDVSNTMTTPTMIELNLLEEIRKRVSQKALSFFWLG